MRTASHGRTIVDGVRRGRVLRCARLFPIYRFVNFGAGDGIDLACRGKLVCVAGTSVARRRLQLCVSRVRMSVSVLGSGTLPAPRPGPFPGAVAEGGGGPLGPSPGPVFSGSGSLLFPLSLSGLFFSCPIFVAVGY